jgi:5-methyltetrahydrofolate--homocysteine methyltransferase
MTTDLVDAIATMREAEALETAQSMLEAGEEPLEVLTLCRKAMSLVGERFEQGQYFLPELVMAGEILSQIADLVKPQIETESMVGVSGVGRVLIGTVQGDVHDIGKDIVVFMLDVNGFEVHDLGVNVPSQAFIDQIVELSPDVVGLSGFLTVAFDAMKETVEAIERAGLRERVKIMIGGGMVDEHIWRYTRADAYGQDAMVAVALAQGWTRGG